MDGLAVGTIVAKNFLPFARVLARSLSDHHPTVPFFAVLADRVDATFAPASEPFETVLLDELEIPDLQRLCFGYSRQQVEFGDPFQASGSRSYFRWLNEPAEGPSGASGSVTRLWNAVYRGRPDLQQAFPDVFAADNVAFREWVCVDGLRDHNVAAVFAR
jgi:hypothetical protein